MHVSTKYYSTVTVHIVNYAQSFMIYTAGHFFLCKQFFKFYVVNKNLSL